MTLAWRWCPGLQDARGAALLTQQALATKAGVNIMTIGRAESGVKRLRAVTIHKIAKALDVHVNVLLGLPVPSSEPTPIIDRRTQVVRSLQRARQSIGA